MKSYLMIASLLLFSISCGTNKEVAEASENGTTDYVVDNQEKDPVEEQDATSANGDVLVTDGVVRDKSADGCGFVIQMMVDANTPSSTYYEPLKLPKEYQEEGKLIRIEYRMSRRPSTCTLALPIIIDKVLTK